MAQGHAIKRLFRPARDLLKVNPAAATAFLLFFLNSAGVAYSSVLFAQFGINFFDHAQLGDLTMSGFRAGFSVVWGALCAFALVGFVVWASSRKETTFSHRNVWGGFGLIAVLVFGMSAIDAWSASGSIKVLNSRPVVVFLQPTSTGEPLRLGDLNLISVIDGTWFLFDRKAMSTMTIPMARIHHLEYPLKWS